MKTNLNVFARVDYQVKRGFRKIYTLHALSRTDWGSIKEFFEHRCAFCGRKEDGTAKRKLVKDHLFPVNEHGDYVIGNIVSTCSSCNDRRGDQKWFEWLKKSYPKKYKIRAAEIRKYIKLHKYKNTHVLKRMNEAQQKKYNDILKSWDKLLNRAKVLRNQIILEKDMQG